MVERIRSRIGLRPGPVDSAFAGREGTFTAGETGGQAANAPPFFPMDGGRWRVNATKGGACLTILVAGLLPIFAPQPADFPNPATLHAASSPPLRQELTLAAAALPAPLADKLSQSKAPDFTLTSLDGSKVTLSGYRGKKGVVLVFFATWCVNCMREVPEIKQFALVAPKQNIEVLAVNFKQRKNIVEKFQKASSIPYPILLDDDGAVTLDKYGIKGLPHIVGVSLKGEIIYRGDDLPVNKTEFIEKLIQGP